MVEELYSVGIDQDELRASPLFVMMYNKLSHHRSISSSNINSEYRYLLGIASV